MRKAIRRHKPAAAAARTWTIRRPYQQPTAPTSAASNYSTDRRLLRSTGMSRGSTRGLCTGATCRHGRFCESYAVRLIQQRDVLLWWWRDQNRLKKWSRSDHIELFIKLTLKDVDKLYIRPDIDRTTRAIIKFLVALFRTRIGTYELYTANVKPWYRREMPIAAASRLFTVIWLSRLSC